MIPSQYLLHLNELRSAIHQLESDPAVRSALLLVADEAHPTAAQLTEVLRATSLPLIGGVFPEVIFQGLRKTSGMVLLPLEFEVHSALIDLSQDESLIQEQIVALATSLGAGARHMFLFLDAFAARKEPFIENVFNCVGNTVTILGGGAGSLSFESFPCVFNNEGIMPNAAVLGLASIQTHIGVAHGWTPISKPMKVTESVQNCIMSIEWRPAFEVYREIVEAHSHHTFGDTNFFEIAKSYPLGMFKLDEEQVVRDPFKAEGTDLYVVDAVEQGQYICVLHGNEPSLIAAALKARQVVESQIEHPLTHKRAFFCIDCISRVLFMGENFSKELDILKGQNTVNGALTIGEIANAGESYLEIFNKTVVLAKWESAI